MACLFRFDLNGLAPLYAECRRRRETTLVFETRIETGVFVGLMFFDHEDDESRDRFFFYMARTNRMFETKLYGNHRQGAFYIYVQPEHVEAFRAELGIEPGGKHPFCAEEFLRRFNAAIPGTLSYTTKIQIFRTHSPGLSRQVLMKRHVSEANKVHWIGLRTLTPPEKPRERTLRKLYLYLDAPAATIERLIAVLKETNTTVCWSDIPPDLSKRRSALSLLQEAQTRAATRRNAERF